MAVAKYLVAGSIILYIYIGALLCNVSCDSGEVLSGRDCVDHVECYICIGALLCSCPACSGGLESPAQR